MTSQADVNSGVYASPRLVRGYARRTPTPAERAVLADLHDEIAGRRVLEIGCGAGTITRELLAAGGTVVGVDVSAAMVEYCRSAFPGATFLVGDMRDLSAHERGSYDVVVAGANVIDIAGRDERPHVLEELRRVLAAEGLLYFSSHNRNSRDAVRAARHGPSLRLSASPRRTLRALAGYLLGTRNHRRLARHQRFEDDYAIINDSAHRWSLLHHYITRDAQRRELEAAGFVLVSVRAPDGRRLDPEDDDGAFTELHYVARAT